MSKHFLTFKAAPNDRPVYLDPDAVEAVHDSAHNRGLYSSVFMRSGRDWVVAGNPLVVMGSIAAARTATARFYRRTPEPAPEPGTLPHPTRRAEDSHPAPPPGPGPAGVEGWPFAIGALPPESVLGLPLADVVARMRETVEKVMAAGGLEPMLDRLVMELGDRLDRRETHTWKRFAASLAKRARQSSLGYSGDTLEAIATVAETASIFGPIGDLDAELGRYGRMVAVCEAARCYVNRARTQGEEWRASKDAAACWDRLTEALFALHCYPDPEAGAQRNAHFTKPAAGEGSHTVRMEAVALTPEQSAELAPILERIEAEDQVAELGELATILFDLNAAIPDVGKPWAQDLRDSVAKARAWLARTHNALQGGGGEGSDA